MDTLLREELQYNLGKEVRIFLKNNFRYKGVVLEVGESAVKLDDHVSGVVVLSLDSISSIVKGEDNGRTK